MVRTPPSLETLGDVRGRRALVRVDFNVPLAEGGGVADDRRIARALPTIRYLAEGGARVVLMSHLGRPRGKPDPALRMDPVAARLSELLGREVRKAEDCVGDPAREVVEGLGEGDAALLENLLPDRRGRIDPRIAAQHGVDQVPGLDQRLGKLPGSGPHPDVLPLLLEGQRGKAEQENPGHRFTFYRTSRAISTTSPPWSANQQCPSQTRSKRSR